MKMVTVSSFQGGQHGESAIMDHVLMLLNEHNGLMRSCCEGKQRKSQMHGPSCCSVIDVGAGKTCSAGFS